MDLVGVAWDCGDVVLMNHRELTMIIKAIEYVTRNADSEIEALDFEALTGHSIDENRRLRARLEEIRRQVPVS